MKHIGIFMAQGCEEIEALTVVDMLRRAQLEVTTISIDGSKKVTGSHNITFFTDADKAEVDFGQLDGIVLPGGMPGTKNLQADAKVQEVIAEFAKEGKLVAAICAAPSVLGEAGLLKGRKAACYPGFEDKLLEAQVIYDEVAVDENVITSRGMGTAIAFSLAIITYFLGAEKAEELAKGVIYRC